MGWGCGGTNWDLISFVSEELVSPLGARGVIKMSHQPTADVELLALDVRPPPSPQPLKKYKTRKSVAASSSAWLDFFASRTTNLHAFTRDAQMTNNVKLISSLLFVFSR